MRYAILVLSLVLASACSSASKKQENKQAAPAAAQKSEAPKAVAAKEVKPKQQQQEELGPMSSLCQNGSDQRKLSTVAQGEGCELHYEKFGNDQTVATAVSGTGHCEEVRGRIVDKLTAAGFDCTK